MFPLAYGKKTLQLSIPETLPVDIVSYRMNHEDRDGLTSIQKIKTALARPVETPPLRELAAGKHNAVILISDGTRLCPSRLLLPLLLEELHAGGIPDEAVDIIIALGMHRKHTEEEKKQLVGEAVYNRVRVHNHSPAEEDCIWIGTTTAGTPIEINRLAAEADLRIVTGNIEPHAMAGISGGIKAVVPGIASGRCIERNHGLSLHTAAKAGKADNPIHRDMEEALQFISVDFLLNVITDHDRHVSDAVAGHVITAHRAGAAIAAKKFLVPVNKLYDVTVVSPGGHPKDLQLYQAMKSLRNASAITKPGGAVLLAAECSEMFGNGIFQYWIETMKNRERMVDKLKQQFVLGAHKVLHLDEVLSNNRVCLYSSLPKPIVALLGFEPVEDLQHTFEQLTDTTAVKNPSIAIMPYGSLTYPVDLPVSP